MSNYFGRYIKLAYKLPGDTEAVLSTNIMERVRVLNENLDKVFHYYDYVVKDGETPEMLAERFYDDPEAHWLILLTNNIVNPYEEWVREQSVFDKYLEDKYGSIAYAQDNILKYYEVYKVVDTATGEITYDKYELSNVVRPYIDVSILNGGQGFSNNSTLILSNVGNVYISTNANNSIVSAQLTSNTYSNTTNVTVSVQGNVSNASLLIQLAPSDWDSLPTDPGSFLTTTHSQVYTPYRETVTIYDWEFAENERRRNIKIVRPDYYRSIYQSFVDLIGSPTLKPGIKNVS